jgi:hypothetical protein
MIDDDDDDGDITFAFAGGDFLTENDEIFALLGTDDRPGLLDIIFGVEALPTPSCFFLAMVVAILWRRCWMMSDFSLCANRPVLFPRIPT